MVLCNAGYGTIDYRPGEMGRPDVHGVILEVRMQEMELMAEESPGYMVQDVAVLAETGEIHLQR